MIETLRRRFALSEKGAKDLIKACIACAIHNLMLFMPVSLLYFLVSDMLEGSLDGKGAFYALSALLAVLLIMVTYRFVYHATYVATYKESTVRRISLAERLRKIPLSYFSHKDIADITTAIMSDSAILETNMSHFVPELAGAMISSAIAAVSLLFFGWRMALAAVWPLPAAFIIVGFSRRVAEHTSRKSIAAKMEAADGIQEFIEAMKDIKASNAEDRFIASLDKKIDNVERRTIIGEVSAAAFVVSAQAILKTGIATTAVAGITLLSSGSISVMTFFMFLLVASRLYDPMVTALQNLYAIIAQKANVERINDILFHDVQSGSSKLTNNGTDIVFDNVSFSYEDGTQVLNGVSFTANQGEVTALVGPSGGGKTTVSRLAARFWDIDKGKISVGGMDVSGADPEELLKLYSIVFQDVTLFEETVMENIRIGRKDATDEEVMEAARLACCTEFIEKLPEKWNTLIGENGSKLSGGERQRISIARAFLKDAKIILLDEATASLDTDNETRIQKAISRLIADKTVLVIAHRMRSVEKADKIVVLKDGKIAEEGTPGRLLEEDGLFARMVSLQKKSSEWAIK